MKQVFTEPLFYIYFVYGVSFLLMSFVVFHGARKASSITFVTTFYMLAGSMKVIGHPRLTKGLVGTGIGFVCYSVFGGLMVEPVDGIPVELFRAVCAVTIAIYSFFILEIFKVSR
jgi:hypothetical protein